MENSTSSLLFPELSLEQRKQIVADFDGGDLTSDGGLLLLAQADRSLGLSKLIAGSISDPRQSGKVRHSLEELVSTRIAAIAMGYPDCNDLSRLGKDPGHLLFSGLKPDSGVLASQPTLSRFENRVESTDLYKTAVALAGRIIAQLPEDTKEVILDVDSTDDPCHGQQELEGFNAHYGNHCFLPLLVHLVDQRGRRWQLVALLRPGRSGGTHGFQPVLKRVFALIRARFPEIKIIVRCDGGFGANDLLTFCETENVSYVIGLAQNPALHRAAKREEMDVCLRYTQEKQHWVIQSKVLARRRLAAEARKAAKAKALAAGQSPCVPDVNDVEANDTQEGVQDTLLLDPDEDYECVEYRRIAYRAGTWATARSMVVKAAITNGELNSRFVVTNLSPYEYSPRGRNFNSREIYWFYCQRGDQENRIKEWKLDLDGGRTSCHRFEANQFRLLLHTAAMFLLNVVQSKLPATRRFKNLQISTLRLRILKVAARITVTCRRIRVYLASSFPHQDVWLHLNRAFASGT